MAKEHTTTESCWYFIGWRKYADFRGCAGRREYWSFQLSVVICLICLFVMEALFIRPAIDNLIRIDCKTLFGPLFYAFLVHAFTPSVAISCRRMHDLGFSGWFAILGVILWAVFIGFLLMLRFSTGLDLAGDRTRFLANGASCSFAAAIIYQIILLGLFCLPGSPDTGK